MKIIWKKFLDILFPKFCVGCHKSGAFLCIKCSEKIPQSEKMNASWIMSMWNYKDPRVKKLLWKFKFENKFSIAEELGCFSAQYLNSDLSDKALFDNFVDVILVPVPLSPKSKKMRGYNQSELLANMICEQLGPDYSTKCFLSKIKDTQTQHSIKNRSDRLKNLRGAYQVTTPSLVVGKNILLIDDITTTHATLVEARRALKEAGAKKIMAFTVAH